MYEPNEFTEWTGPGSSWMEEDMLVYSGSWVDADWRHTFDRLKELERLSDNYDSEGSKAPREDYINIATLVLFREFMRGSKMPDHVSAEGDGSVLIEWRSSENSVEVLIDSLSSVEWMQVRGNKTDFAEESVRTLIKDVEQWLPRRSVPAEDMSSEHEGSLISPPSITFEAEERLAS